jgi:2-polyprenyl-6-methoxyphenol hydroxylase-like FAD-dependent oxidoreductase
VFDYVFAADGAKSIVRRRLEIPFDGETFKPEMYLSDYELLNPSPLPAA